MPSDSAASRIACRAAFFASSGPKTAVQTSASTRSVRKRAGFVTLSPPSNRAQPERRTASRIPSGDE